MIGANLAPAAGGEQRFEDLQAHMGTRFEIVLYAPSEAVAAEAFEAAFKRVADLDEIMSDYKPESELSQLFKASPTAEPVPVSKDLLQVLKKSAEVSKLTGGAFDVTVGPLSRIWRRARRRKKMPDRERLHAALRSVGNQHLRVDVASATVSLLKPGMRLDLGGIAKGYAADEVLILLARRGIRRALVSAGGDIALAGPPPDAPGWRIGLSPLEPREGPEEFVWVSGSAVATSGDAWQFVEIDGVRYSHILDPRTGLGTRRRGGVTVVARDGATADSLASALSVLEVEDGVRLIEQIPGASARFVWLDGGKPRVRLTHGFPATQRDSADRRGRGTKQSAKSPGVRSK